VTTASVYDLTVSALLPMVWPTLLAWEVTQFPNPCPW
jgi:hypothetical protein